MSPDPRTDTTLPSPGEPAVDAAVAELNRIYRIGGLRTALELGRYLVEHVFADPVAVADAAHPTWRALADRDDLEPSHSFLWSSVGVLRLHEQLPADVRDQLGVSSLRRLLTVKDDDTRLRLATRAAREPLTVVGLEQAIAAEAPGPRRGRKPVPAPVKAVRAAARQLDRVETGDFAALGGPAAQALLAELDATLAAANALRDRLQQLVQAPTP